MIDRKRKKVVIASGRVAEMGLADVVRMIGEKAYKRARKSDPRPMFVEMTAAHEGVSSGRLSSDGAPGRPERKRWPRRAIQEIGRLLAGVPVFAGHSRGGPHHAPVGKVLTSSEVNREGALSISAVSRISDPGTKERLRSGELDACSIEAEIECHRDPRSTEWIVGGVRRVTAIALGDSRMERPGFPGAMVTATVEEFEEEADAADSAEGPEETDAAGAEGPHTGAKEGVHDPPGPTVEEFEEEEADTADIAEGPEETDAAGAEGPHTGAKEGVHDPPGPTVEEFEEGESTESAQRQMSGEAEGVHDPTGAGKGASVPEMIERSNALMARLIEEIGQLRKERRSGKTKPPGTIAAPVERPGRENMNPLIPR